MFDAANEESIAVFDPFVRAWPMHIMKGELQAWKEEDIEHFDRGGYWNMKLLNSSREKNDHVQCLALLGSPAAIKAGVGSKIPDCLVMGDRQQVMPLDLDFMSSERMLCDG